MAFSVPSPSAVRTPRTQTLGTQPFRALRGGLPASGQAHNIREVAAGQRLGRVSRTFPARPHAGWRIPARRLSSLSFPLPLSAVNDSPGTGTGRFAGRYEIVRELGRGATATVFLARDAELDRQVAIKLLRPGFIGSAATAFLREIRIAPGLRHPHIVPVLDSGEHEGQLYIVLPFMEGGTLRAKLETEKQLPLEMALAIVATLSDALDFAHRAGVIHRDVKPENILFADGAACLSDFGIARAIAEASGDSSATTSGILRGTPAYMSPEQAAGEKTLDGRTDIYALGLTFYEMITGVQAFTGPTAESVIAMRMYHAPHPLRVYRPTVPTALERVMDKVLMVARADRYQTCRAFVDDLRVAALQTSAEVKAPSRSGRRRRIVVVAAVAIAGTVAAAPAAWRIARPRDIALDANKVMVFPLVQRGRHSSDSHTGDEVALLIGSALEHTEPLKWIDGWTWLDSSQRVNGVALTAAQARAIARSRGARFYLEGWMIQGRDSATVVTRLVDVRGDSVVAQTSATGAGRIDSESVPLLGLRAVVRLLPLLVEPSSKIDIRPILERKPAAVASFLQGEREYRQARFVSALGYYRRAVETDSSLSFAALKGAQAANWANRNAEAHDLVRLSLTQAPALPPKYAQFARGLDAFLSGMADSAETHYRQAIALDSAWAEAWTAFGETFFHLFPKGQAWDSVAEVAFDRARRADRDFTPPLVHLTELAMRRHDVPRARLLLGDFRRGNPDTSLATQLQLTVDCASGRLKGSAWNDWARRFPEEVARASKTLAMLARRYDCAEDGFRAVLAADSVSVSGRWMATLGLQSLWLAQGRPADAERVVDSAVAGGLRQAMALYIVDAAAGFGMEARANEAMQLVAGKYAEMPSYRLWYHNTWESHRRNIANLTAIDAALGNNAAKSGSADDRFFANVASAHLALARNDSADALRKLRALDPRGAPNDIAWGLWEPLAAERLTLARLLLARGEFQEALRVAETFDHPQPVIDLIFLPESLVLRLKAARALHDVKLERLYRERLALLGRNDLAK